MRPATRIGREVAFSGGLTGRLTLRAYLLCKLGLKSRVNVVRDFKVTRFPRRYGL